MLQQQVLSVRYQELGQDLGDCRLWGHQAVQLISASGSESCTTKEMLMCPCSSRAKTLAYAIFTALPLCCSCGAGGLPLQRSAHKELSNMSSMS